MNKVLVFPIRFSCIEKYLACTTRANWEHQSMLLEKSKNRKVQRECGVTLRLTASASPMMKSTKDSFHARKNTASIPFYCLVTGDRCLLWRQCTTCPRTKKGGKFKSFNIKPTLLSAGDGCPAPADFSKVTDARQKCCATAIGWLKWRQMATMVRLLSNY